MEDLPNGLLPRAGQASRSTGTHTAGGREDVAAGQERAVRVSAAEDGERRPNTVACSGKVEMLHIRYCSCGCWSPNCQLTVTAQLRKPTLEDPDVNKSRHMASVGDFEDRLYRHLVIVCFFLPVKHVTLNEPPIVVLLRIRIVLNVFSL